MTPKPARRGFQVRRETWVACLFILPSFLGTILFWIGPAMASGLLAFYEWDFLSTPRFVGGQNFFTLFGDPVFFRSLLNTLYFMVVSVPFGLALSLALALLVNRAVRGMSFYRTAFFLPVVTSFVAAGLVWRWIFNDQYGLLNAALGALHLPTPGWLSDPAWAMPAVILMSIWKVLGYNMVIFLAGLQGLPQDLYDAAKIDGASSWQKFRHLTFPLLSPTTFFAFVISMISALQVFDQAYVMTEGGPADATLTVTYYLYRQGFQYFDLGYASTVAIVLFMMTLLFTLIQWFGVQRKVFYD